ncbi:phosphotransferase [Cohnella panacarvi]|uniref:phosphotransferase n=1 Tax=Cohnella panacarvi TaxID=400776 RepID=UPI00047B2E06|nr:phosphotransferase [Cohnella panacarvi]
MRLPANWREETIYTAMDGRTVSRIRSDDGRSYIRKPVSPNSRELWIYENVLGELPLVYPRILVNPLSEGGMIEEHSRWIWFEDLGPLKHEYDLKTARALVRTVARWHNADMESESRVPKQGLKPSYREAAVELVSKREHYAAVASEYGMDPRKLAGIYSELERSRPSDELVFSHGDLHVGNYAFANGRLCVMDWEHAHLSSRHWDLFHLIDLTHPLYPRKIELEWRDALLHDYFTETDKLGMRLDRRTFLAEYMLFAAVYSLWMLRLIRSDLEKPDCVWTHAQLRRQADETARILHQLLQR